MGKTITQETVGGIDLALTHHCSVGAEVTFSPPEAAVIEKSVAVDKGLVAAVIQPVRKRFVIYVTGPSGNRRALKVRLHRLVPP